MYNDTIILDTIDSGVLVVDRELRVLFWNNWLSASTGISKEQALTRQIGELIDIEPMKMGALRRNITTSLAMGITTFLTPSIYSYLIKIPIKNRVLTSFENMQQEIKITPIDIESGEVAIFISDSTAVMDSKKTLDRERQILEDIIDTKESILFLTDGNSILLANQRFLTFFDSASIEQFNSKDFCFGKYLEQIDGCFCLDCAICKENCNWLELVASQDNQKRFVAIKNKKGSVTYFIIHVNRSKSSKNEYVVTLTDATQEFLYQKELEKLVEIESAKRIEQERLLMQRSRQALLGEMIAAISHQMKQPLSSIKMLACDLEFLSATGELDSKQLDSNISMIHKQVAYMNETITSFRNFLMPSGGTDRFDLIYAIKDVTRLLSAAMKDFDMDLNIGISGSKQCTIGRVSGEYLDECEQIFVLGNETEFKQVLINLISNTKDALKAVKKASGLVVGSVVLQVLKKDDGSVKIRYKDNAGGIPDDILSTLFDPYTTTKGKEGTGIGMYMSKQIVEKMGGTIEAENVAGGAMFTISLKGFEE